MCLFSLSDHFPWVWLDVMFEWCFVLGYKQEDGFRNIGQSGCWRGAQRLRSAGSKIQSSDFWFEGLLAASANDQGWFVCVRGFVGVCSRGSAEVFLWRKGVRVVASWQRRSSLLTCVCCLWAEASLVRWLPGDSTNYGPVHMWVTPGATHWWR